MAQAIDIGPAVLLQKRLAWAAFASGATIYLEAIVTLVVLDERMVSPLIVAPVLAVQAAQFVVVRNPARRLVSETLDPNGQRANPLVRAYRVHLVLAAAFVGLLWLGGSSDEARTMGRLLGAIVVASCSWPVVRTMRAARSVQRAIRGVQDPGVLCRCLSHDLREALQFRLRAMGGQRMRWAAPLLAASVALVVSLLALAATLQTLGLQNGPVGPVSAAVALTVYYRSVRRAKLRAAELRATDSRPPVLMLRQFGDDTLGAGRFNLGSSPTFEHAVASALMRIGPTVSVGKPGERVQPLGAAREYLDDPDWRGAVETLIKDAALVVFVLGDSESVLWEFRTAIAARGAAKVLILVPPPGDAADLRRRWSRFVASTADIVGGLPSELPERRVLAICFMGNSPVLIVSDQRQARISRRETDYRVALRLFERLPREGLTSANTLEAWVARNIPIVDVVSTGRSQTTGP